MSVKAEDYTYKVTIYSGKQGTFTGIPGNLVKGNNATVSISDDKSAIVIDKLNPKDPVNMSEILTSVSLGSNSKYYVRGIKESGRDNSEKLARALIQGERRPRIRSSIRNQRQSGSLHHQLPGC